MLDKYPTLNNCLALGCVRWVLFDLSLWVSVWYSEMPPPPPLPHHHSHLHTLSSPLLPGDGAAAWPAACEQAGSAARCLCVWGGREGGREVSLLDEGREFLEPNLLIDGLGWVGQGSLRGGVCG